MQSEQSLLTVLLPVRAVGEFFQEALVSTLNQSMRDFKVLLIADTSLDLNFYEKYDHRVRHVKVSANLNLSQKLNIGLELTNTKYIARMDADDIAHPDRFSAQVEYLEKFSEVDILGTGIRFIGSLSNHRNNPGEIATLPEKNDELLAHMLYKNPFFHPTVMIRSENLNKYQLRYNEKYIRSQDYELWTRAAGKLVFANLKEPFLDYRLHESQSGVVEYIDSQYFSSLAKLKYCCKTIMSLNSRTMAALRILPFRVQEFLISSRARGI